MSGKVPATAPQTMAVAQLFPQHRLTNGSPQHDLRQRVHGKVAQRHFTANSTSNSLNNSSVSAEREF